MSYSTTGAVMNDGSGNSNVQNITVQNLTVTATSHHNCQVSITNPANAVQLSINCPVGILYSAIQVGVPGVGEIFLVGPTGNVGCMGSITAEASISSGGGLGVWNANPPTSQPALCITLADVIAVLVGAGLCAAS